MTYITYDAKGKPRLSKDQALVEITDETLPDENKKIDEFISELDTAVLSVEPNLHPNSLSNAHGDWYEYLIAIQSWNKFLSGDFHLAMLLPNISTFDVAKIYEPELENLVNDLRNKVDSASNVSLVTSNPDFVIIRRDLVFECLSSFDRIEDLSLANINFLKKLYQNFINRANFHSIVGYASVKYSFRPDRRLQIAHEGSLMKSIYVHLQTRQWILNPEKIKYYAIAGKVSNKDRGALNTVATHSIITVNSLPQKAVDEVFEANSLTEMAEVLAEILKIH